MKTAQVTINHSSGLHARPAAVFVKTAASFRSTITIKAGEKQANAKSIVSVLTLGAKQGTLLTITAEGEDEDQAIAALTHLIETNFEGA